jgi:hypothetical protein
MVDNLIGAGDDERTSPEPETTRLVMASLTKVRKGT